MRELSTEVLIVGGGLGGTAAALSVSRLGRKVILTEETDWIGGQLTSQAVPPDEHFMMESLGCTRTYRKFRNGIRDIYKTYYPLRAESYQDPTFNPGASLVSRISAEPRVGLAVLENMLAPYRAKGDLEILKNHMLLSAETDNDRVIGVRLKDLQSNDDVWIKADYVLDATETGELLPLTGTEYVIGRESRDDTGEPSALAGQAEMLSMQSITWVFAVDYRAGENHVINKPDDYDFWRNYQADYQINKHFSWNPKPKFDACFFPEEDPDKFSLWQYRRVLYKNNFLEGFFDSDITIINAPQNDYTLGPIIEVSEEEREKHLKGARNLSLSFLYWLQTEAPRLDGKTGYPGLRLRPDVTGTKDGLAKMPYIRESRRIKAEFTVLEQHIRIALRETDGRAERFYDSVGIGSYPIDIHRTTGVNPKSVIDSNVPLHFAYPFQIPLGALIPIRIENLLPAAKNLGVTHITNGSYRLHPIEWNIGEAAGALAAYCLNNEYNPKNVRNDSNKLENFQSLLDDLGIEREWPDVVHGPTRSYHKWAITVPNWKWHCNDKMPRYSFF